MLPGGTFFLKLISFVCCYIISIPIVWATPAINQIGDDVYYTYDSVLEKLTITGTGAMWDSEWFSNREERMESDSPFCNNSIGSITSIHVNEGIAGIGAYNFTMCSVAEVYLPTTLCTISKYAFGDCPKLSSIIQNGTQLTEISEGVFFKCRALRDFPFEEYNLLDKIENRAFACSGLEEVSIPSNVTYIGDTAFSSTVHWSIIIPDSVTSIGIQAFLPPYWYGENEFPLYFIGQEDHVEIADGNSEKRFFSWSPVKVSENWGNGTATNIMFTQIKQTRLQKSNMRSVKNDKMYFADGGGIEINSDSLQLENGWYSFYSIDEMGNETTTQYKVTMVDRIAPRFSVSVNGSKITVDVNDF